MKILDETRVFKRSNTIGKHKIDTALTLYPPVGKGVGGALPRTHLEVKIDGKKKIDCNIGYLPGGGEEVEQIMICPEDNAIFITAYDLYGVKNKGICGQVNFMDDPELITNDYIRASK